MRFSIEYYCLFIYFCLSISWICFTDIWNFPNSHVHCSFCQLYMFFLFGQLSVTLFLLGFKALKEFVVFAVNSVLIPQIKAIFSLCCYTSRHSFATIWESMCEGHRPLPITLDANVDFKFGRTCHLVVWVWMQKVI